MYKISEEDLATRKEIEIRGRYLMMACDIEYCLLNIIMFCNPDPHNHDRAGQFTEMKMAAKINNVIADLKKYKLNYYHQYKKELDGLEEFRTVRNDMSHCKGSFPNEPDLSVFRITFPAKTDKENRESKQESMRYKDYTTEYMNESIQRFASINARLAELWFRLKLDWDSQANPFVHSDKK